MLLEGTRAVALSVLGGHPMGWRRGIGNIAGWQWARPLPTSLFPSVISAVPSSYGCSVSSKRPLSLVPRKKPLPRFCF